MKPMKAFLAAALVLGTAIPVAADTSFNFEEWFRNLSKTERPEVGIRLDPERRAGGYCESDLTNRWPTCFTLVFFRAYIRNDEPNATGRPLTVDVSWTTATGLSGHDTFDDAQPVIRVNGSQSNRVIIQIPDDDIAHGCNKLIVHVRSLTPGLYKAMPYIRGQGFEYVTYIDDDGGNPDASDSNDDRVAYYKNRFTKYCH